MQTRLARLRWLVVALSLIGVGRNASCHTAGTSTTAQKTILQRSRAVVAALAADDTAKLSAYVDPTRGVRFSPFGFSTQDPLWTPRQVAALHDDTRLHAWSHDDRTAQPLHLTWHDFRARYIYNANFAAAHVIHAVPVTARTFRSLELKRVYADGWLVEYAATGPRGHGVARSLGLLWQRGVGGWYLTAVANHAGTFIRLAPMARAKRSRPLEADRWDTIAFILSLFAAVIFVPISIEKVVSRQPFVTQTLIALNVCIFLMTVAVANVYLPQDREAGQSLLARYPAFAGVVDERLALEHAHDPQGFKEVWQMEHASSDFVLEPHYSVLNRFAYRPAEPSLALKLLGLLGSMFLHGNFLHLAGNMIFLWVFGRALEEKLGHWPYLTRLASNECSEYSPD